MIPKSVIEKAIEGGWKDAMYLVVDEHHRYFELAALDPTFWRGLSKALGWPKTKETVIARDGAVETVQSPNEIWFDVAHRFYDFILTGGDIEKFWADILKI